MNIIVILGLFLLFAKEAGWTLVPYESICGFMACLVGTYAFITIMSFLLFAWFVYYVLKKGTEYGRNNKNI